jgi:hypothetical protein
MNFTIEPTDYLLTKIDVLAFVKQSYYVYPLSNFSLSPTLP